MSKIEWTGETWNPIAGCSIVSPGCTNCYAMKMAHRLAAMGVPHYQGLTTLVKGNIVWTGKLAQAPASILLKPLSWKKPRRIFANSMSDLFHEDVPEEVIDRIFAVMAVTPWHTYQVLTKRSARMLAYLSDTKTPRRIYDLVCDLVTGLDVAVILIAPGVDERYAPPGPRVYLGAWPLPNVWLGVSAEDQRRYDERKEDLRNTPASVHFFSLEPLLGPIKGDYFGEWVIIGGESGKDARPMHPDWARSIRDQCQAAGVPFFFKQHGNWVTTYDRDVDDPDWRRCPQHEEPNGRYVNLAGGHGFHGERVVYMRNVGKARAGRLLDGRTWDEMPNNTGVPAR